MQRHIRNSGKALLLREGRLLAVRIEDPDETYYVLPGGGQEPEEPLTETVRRECAEELARDVRVGDLAFVVEIARDSHYHRVDLVFHCEDLGPLPGIMAVGDSAQTGVEWLPVEELHRLPLYPARLRRAIQRLARGERGLVYLGNEELGDQE